MLILEVIGAILFGVFLGIVALGLWAVYELGTWLTGGGRQTIDD